MIEIETVSVSFGRAAVLHDISLAIPAQRLTALIGPNGAGKSTLLGVIARLIPPQSGRVQVAGLDVARTPSHVVARTLAILKQENHVLTQLAVEDLVGFGRFPHARGRLSADDRAKVAEALHYVDLSEAASRRLGELSGGQRQRAFLAMVLAQDTPYVLLDEPLNNLDPKQAVGMMRLLRRAVDQLGKTVVMVVHDINCASCYADWIVALREGSVVSAGPASEVLTPTHLRAIYDTDIRVHDIDGRRIAQPYL